MLKISNNFRPQPLTPLARQWLCSRTGSSAPLWRAAAVVQTCKHARTGLEKLPGQRERESERVVLCLRSEAHRECGVHRRSYLTLCFAEMQTLAPIPGARRKSVKQNGLWLKFSPLALHGFRPSHCAGIPNETPLFVVAVAAVLL